MQQNVYHQEQIVRLSQERGLNRARRHGTLDFYTQEELAQRSSSPWLSYLLRSFMKSAR